jgi:hypothetical protein
MTTAGEDDANSSAVVHLGAAQPQPWRPLLGRHCPCATTGQRFLPSVRLLGSVQSRLKGLLMAGAPGAALGSIAIPLLRSSVGTRSALLAVPIAVLSIASVVGNVLAPRLLITNPVLLAALCPRTLHLAVAAATMPLSTFLVVGVIRLGAGDPWHYLLGRKHGPAVAGALARRNLVLGRFTAWLLSIVDRKAVIAVATSPTGKVLMLAGAARARPSRVAAADITGTLLQLAAIYATGRPVVEALHPRGLATIGMVTLLVAAGGPAVFVGIRARARRAQARSVGTSPAAAELRA